MICLWSAHDQKTLLEANYLTRMMGFPQGSHKKANDLWQLKFGIQRCSFFRMKKVVSRDFCSLNYTLCEPLSSISCREGAPMEMCRLSTLCNSNWLLLFLHLPQWRQAWFLRSNRQFWCPMNRQKIESIIFIFISFIVYFGLIRRFKLGAPHQKKIHNYRCANTANLK